MNIDDSVYWDVDRSAGGEVGGGNDGRLDNNVGG